MSSMMQDYDFSKLSEMLRNSYPETWEKLGWMQSTLNNMPEEDDKKLMQELSAKAINFYRSTQITMNMRESIRVVVKISQLSCLEQGLELRNPLSPKI